jgi:ankyrin repeat protein
MNLRKIVLMSLTLCIPVTLFGMETSTYEVSKGQAEPDLLSFTLEDQLYTFFIGPLLKHITRYQKGIDNAGQDKLLGFHHYKFSRSQELSVGVTLSVVQDNLWVLALGDSTKFHKGYVIYQGKAFPKTFFPISWDKDSIGTYIAYLLSSGKHSVKIKNHPDGLTKTYGVTLTDSNGQALYCIIHGCPLIPESMRLVTVYPLVPASPEPENLSLTLKTIAYEQMQKIQAATKKHIPNPELIVALQKKDSERAYQLLSLDSDANVYDSKDKSALMYAATAGDWSLVNTLLEHDADALAQDNAGNTAFHYALESGDYFTALGLINPRLINKANKQDTTPLGIALKNKNIEALELLLQFKANITAPDAFGRSPLMLAVKAYQGKADLAFCKIALTLLLQAGADVNAQDTSDNTALHYAVESSSKELVQLLLSTHACLSTPNTKNETPLMLAKKLNYTPIVTLFESIEKEKQEWLQESKGTELMYATKTVNIPEVKKLLAKGVNINAQDSYGWTALTYAIEKGNSELVALLVDAGADPCIKLSSGHSPLSYAQSQKNTLIIEALEKKIAELETPALENKKKEQEYLKAYLTRFKDDLDKGELSQETLSALSSFKNKILNAKSSITPLLYAVKEQKHRVIQQLLEHGADITAVDSQKHDALALAYAQSDIEALRILLQYSPYARISELLIQALTQNNDELSKLICTQVNGLAYQALIKVIREGNQALVSKLVTQQLIPTEAGQAFIIALLKGNSDAARLIIKTCPQVVSYKDTHGMTLLMHSTHHNFLELVKLLVEAGADIHALDNDNKRARDYTSSKTPIYHYLLAQEQSFEQTKKQELQKAAKELIKQELQQKGWSELAIAASIGDIDYVKAYQGNNINTLTPEGDTPLVIAAKNNNDNLVALLLTKPEINVNARDRGGHTPLMHAALNENNSVVAMLLQHGAHPCVCNNQKATALDLIKGKKNGSQLIISSLQESRKKIITTYLARISKLDEDILKELQATFALPIVFPTSYLTPLSFIPLVTILSKNCKDMPNFIELLHQAVDDPQAIQNCIDMSLLLLAQDPTAVSLTFPLNSTLTFNNVIPTAQLLLNVGANVNVKDAEGSTPLMYACDLGYPSFVQFLLNAKAKVNTKNKHTRTALSLASEQGHTDIVRLLLAQPTINVNKKNGYNRTPLDFAAEMGHTETVKLLLNAKAEVDAKNSSDNTPLIGASHGGHHDTVQLLLKAKANPHEKGEQGTTPLLAALKNNHTDIAKLLIAGKADVNVADSNGITPLIVAIYNKNREAIELLIKAGANVNYISKEDYTTLTYATDPMILKLLITAGANVNAQDKDKHTPLMLASREGNCEMIQLLLESGAIVNAQDSAGFTPLMYAISHKHNDKRSETVKLLLQAGADVNVKNVFGHTPLTSAIASGYTEIIRLLITVHTNIDLVNTQDKEGVTILMQAASIGDSEKVKLLLDAGADPNMKDNKGQTALTYAQMSKNTEIVKLLENSMKS